MSPPRPLSPVGHIDCGPSPVGDPFGYHQLKCKSAASARLRRHNAIASVIANCALKADPRAFQMKKEIGFNEDASRSRHGDVSMDLADKRTLLDVTVANPYTSARICASRNAGSPAVAAEAFDRKIRKYSDLFSSAIDQNRARFVPLAITASGAWDERLPKWLHKFSNACAAASGTDAGSHVAELMARLPLAL